MRIAFARHSTPLCIARYLESNVPRSVMGSSFMNVRSRCCGESFPAHPAKPIVGFPSCLGRIVRWPARAALEQVVACGRDPYAPLSRVKIGSPPMRSMYAFSTSMGYSTSPTPSMRSGNFASRAVRKHSSQRAPCRAAETIDADTAAAPCLPAKYRRQWCRVMYQIDTHRTSLWRRAKLLSFGSPQNIQERRIILRDAMSGLNSPSALAVF